MKYTWRGKKGTNVCELCNVTVTPKNGGILVFGDGSAKMFCNPCMVTFLKSHHAQVIPVGSKKK